MEAQISEELKEARNLLIAFQTLFGSPALSSLAFHTIDIAVCLRSSAAISIFSRSAFLRFFKNDKPPPRIPTSVAFPSQNPLRIQKYVDMWD